MTLLTEGDLQVSFKDASGGRKFDGDEHGLSHCMKAVDFIVEFDDRYLFIEFKDPQHPLSVSQNQEDFIQQFQSGLLDEDLKYKCRDTFLYEWASGRVDKPVNYLVLIALDTLTEAELTRKTEDLKAKLPILGPDGHSWTRPFVSECAVFNIESWNRRFPRYQVERLSEA